MAVASMSMLRTSSLSPHLIVLAKRSQSSLSTSVVQESAQSAQSPQSTKSAQSTKTNAKPFKDMPSPPEWPLIGHLPLMMKKESQERMHIFFDKLRQELGDPFRITVPGQGNMVVVSNPVDAKHFYSADGKVPIIPGFDSFGYVRKEIMQDRYVTAGLIVNTEDWYTVRSQVQQDMMRPKSAFYYIEEIEDIAKEMVEKIAGDLGDSQVMDVRRAVQEFALEAVGCIFMGARLGTIKGEGDGQRLIEIQDITMPQWMKLFFFPNKVIPYTPGFGKLQSLMEESFDICKKHVDAAIDRVTDQDESILAKLVRKCGKESGIPLIMGIDALQVGIDTTGTSASFLLYHLASNPEKQEKLYREICHVIGPQGNMSEQALVKMKFLKACQTESQRMMPAVFGSSRRTTVDLELGGYQVPAGTTVIRNGQVMSNDPDNFTEPQKFMPERWIRGCPEKNNANSFANVPFGHGARSCIGRRFAQLELYILMAKVVQRFRLEYDGPEIGVYTKFINYPDKEVNIKFIERSQLS